MEIGVADPPKNSGLCNLASELCTPKWAKITSIYLDPPLAFLSNHSCNLNALLKSFMLEAVASVKSTSVWFVISNCLGVFDALLSVKNPAAVPTPVPDCKVSPPFSDPSVLLYQDARLKSSFAPVIFKRGAVVPKGIVASGPFCVQGNALVK